MRVCVLDVELIFPFLCYRCLQVVLDGKSSQKYPDNAGLIPASIFDLAFLLLYITDFPYTITCIISIYADDTTLQTKCDHNGASDLWQKVDLASKIESDQKDTAMG